MSERIEYSVKGHISERTATPQTAEALLAQDVEAAFMDSELADTVKVENALRDSPVANAAEQVDAIFTNTQLPDVFKPGRPPTVEQITEGDSPHDPVTVVKTKVENAFIEAGLANAFHHSEEEPPQTSTVNPLLYLHGQGQIARTVEEGARRAGLDGTSGQSGDTRPTDTNGGTEVYSEERRNRTARENATSLRMEPGGIRIPQQRSPGVRVPSSLRVSGAFGPVRPARKIR
jgi:hypothetical protein